MIVDMHVHTARGGYDSSLTVPELVNEAQTKGVGCVCLTEHMHFWSQKELDAYRTDHNVVLVAAIEVETDMGHMLAYGLHRYVSGMHRAVELRRVVDEVDGFLVLAHPYRMFFHLEEFNVKPTREWSRAVEDALEHTALELVDALEVLNGGNSERENRMALEVASRLGMKETGGSDAHSERGIATFATILERDISNERELIAELKAGRFKPALRLRNGDIVPYHAHRADEKFP